MAKWMYDGDMNVENGGSYYNLDSLKWGYVDVISVEPAAWLEAKDTNNIYYVSTKSIAMHTKNIRNWFDVVKMYGYSNLHVEPFGDDRIMMYNGPFHLSNNPISLNDTQFLLWLAIVHNETGHNVEADDQGEYVVIGKNPAVLNGATRLKASASIERYVKKEYLI